MNRFLASMSATALALILSPTETLLAQNPPPGRKPTNAETARICDAIKMLEDFKTYLCSGAGQSMPEPLKSMGKARAATAKKIKPGLRIVENLTAKPWRASGWTNPEWTVNMQDARGTYSHFSSGVAEDDEMTRLDDGEVEGSGPENGYSTLFAKFNLAQLLGHEAHRHVQELCLFSGCDAIIQQHRSNLGDYPVGGNFIGLLALQQSKELMQSNMDMMTIDLAFWEFAQTQGGQSQEDKNRIKQRITRHKAVIKLMKDEIVKLCAEIAKR